MKKETLVVLWTGNSLETAKNMVFMYTKNAKVKGWWKHVIFIIWGASAKLAAENKEVRTMLKEMLDEGITLEACKACTDLVGVSQSLEELGVDVKFIGKDFTAYLKEEYTVITL